MDKPNSQQIHDFQKISEESPKLISHDLIDWIVVDLKKVWFYNEYPIIKENEKNNYNYQWKKIMNQIST